MNQPDRNPVCCTISLCLLPSFLSFLPLHKRTQSLMHMHTHKKKYSLLLIATLTSPMTSFPGSGLSQLFWISSVILYIYCFPSWWHFYFTPDVSAVFVPACLLVFAQWISSRYFTPMPCQEQQFGSYRFWPRHVLSSHFGWKYITL